MDTFAEIRTSVLSDLNASSTSSQYPTATVDSAINRAYILASSLFRWPILNDALQTTTQKDINYYDAPENWRPMSIWRVEIDGDPYGDDPDYSPIVFKDFLDWQSDSDNDDSTDKKWSVQWRRYFVYPAPTAAGLVITVWGQENVETLTNDADETIFTGSQPECNEAIAKEAVAILKHKGELPEEGQMLSQTAKVILVVAFDKVKQEKSKYEKLYPFLDVQDFYGRTSTVKDMTGRF